MTREAELAALLSRDVDRWQMLGAVRALRLPDGWIGAGFVRNAVWDHLHGLPPSPPRGDVDVVWHGPGHAHADTRLESRLRVAVPGVAWSVKDQARMHGRNGDPPYRSTWGALAHWPETATAVAVRRTGTDGVEICAPYGLDDLFGLLLRPTPGFVGARHVVCEARASSKGWLTQWPGLRWAVSPARDPGTTPPP